MNQELNIMMVNKMPIIIPSSKIYDFSNKILNKQNITKINIPYISGGKYKRENTEVYVHTESPMFRKGTPKDDEEYSRSGIGAGGQTTYYFVFAYSYIQPLYYQFNFTIPKSNNNITIESISSDISIDITGTLEKGKVSQKFRWDESPLNEPDIISVDSTQTDQKFTKITSHKVPAELAGTFGVEAESSFDETEYNEITIDEENNKYRVWIKTLSGYIIKDTTFADTVVVGTNVTPYPDFNELTAEGSYTAFYPTQIVVRVNGNTLEIDFKDGIESIGGGEKVFEVPESTLLQSGMTPYITTQFTKTLEAYKNGKETATILASIGEYYDENGNLAISTKKQVEGNTKMVFDIGDKVIPQVYGADGKDRPLSLYKDLTPKVFRVCGTKIFYDGAVWQELTLQEVNKGV